MWVREGAGAGERVSCRGAGWGVNTHALHARVHVSGGLNIHIQGHCTTQTCGYEQQQRQQRQRQQQARVGGGVAAAVGEVYMCVQVGMLHGGGGNGWGCW